MGVAKKGETMNKKAFRIAGWALGLSLAIGGISSAFLSKRDGTLQTSASDSSFIPDALSIDKTYFTVTTAKSSGSNAPTFVEDTNIRIYPGNTVTVVAETGYVLNGISLSGTVNANKKGTYPSGWSITDGSSSLVSGSITSTGSISPSKTGVTKNTLVFTCSGSAGNIDITSITVSYSADVTTLDAVSSISATVTAKQGADSWTVTDFSATGTLSDVANRNVTSYVDYVVNTAVPNETSDAYTVQFTVSKKDGVAGEFTSGTFNITDATVSADPFISYSLVTDSALVNSRTLYALGDASKDHFATTSAADNKIATVTSNSNAGLFRLVPSGAANKYLLQFITGSSFPYTEGKYVNNSSSTNITNGEDAEAASKWVLEDGTDKVYLKNSSNGDRHIGFTGTDLKAYASSNIGSNPPAYLYSVATDTLTDIAPVSQTTTFTVGQSFAFGGNVTATYSLSGTTGHTGITSGLTYKFKASGAGSFGDMPAAFNIGHNGGTVQVTYTDAWGSTAVVTYDITVNYATLTGFTLNSGSTLVLGKDDSYTFVATPNTNANPSVTWSATSGTLVEGDDFDINETTGLLELAASDAGTIVVTATSTVDGSISASCTVTVTTEAVVNLDTTSLTGKFTGDEDALLVATATGFSGEKTITWESSNPAVATVTQDEDYDEMATVHYVGTGTATITVSVTTVANGTKTDTCSVEVTTSAVTAMTLNKTSGTIYVGVAGHNTDNIAVSSYTKVGNATEGVTWGTSNPSVATVSSGTVTAVGVGNATITARSTYTTSTVATYTVTVKNDSVTSIASWTGWNASQFNVFEGDKLTEATVNGWNITGSWESGAANSKLTYGTQYSLSTNNGAIESLPYTWQATDNKITVTAGSGTSNKTVTVVPLLNPIDVAGIGDLEESFVAEDQGWEHSETISGQTWSSGEQFQIKFNKGTASTECRYWEDDKTARVYKNGNFVISSKTSSNLTSLTFDTFGGVATVNTGTFEDGVWSGDAKSVTFSITSNAKFKGVTLTYSGEVVTHYANVNVAAQKAVISFANDFLTKTTSMEIDEVVTTICKADGSTDIDALKAAWAAVSSNYTTLRNALSEENKTAFDNMVKNAASDEDGDVLEQAMARYDHILIAHPGIDGLGDFINTTSGRAEVSGLGLISDRGIVSSMNSSVPAIIALLSGGIVAAGGIFLMSRRRRER